MESVWRFVPADLLGDLTAVFSDLDVRAPGDPGASLGSFCGFVGHASTAQPSFVVIQPRGWAEEPRLVPLAYSKVDVEQQVIWVDASAEHLAQVAALQPEGLSTVDDGEREWLDTFRSRLFDAYENDPGVNGQSVV
ncbi:MAG: hypothetical protein U0Q12_13715 [Vicinamibacterales bacterium]